MPNYDPQRIALFRYQVIAPLISLSGPRGTLGNEIHRLAQRKRPPEPFLTHVLS
jgi:hypothetical protein